MKGSESVSCTIENSEKEGITVIGAVDALGTRLPLTVIGKGKTSRCSTALNLPLGVWEVTSDSGWTTCEVMCRCFQLLRQQLCLTGPLIVLLDAYSAHRAEITRSAAVACRIELVFIPPGCTDRLQPLDRHIFGVLKAHARRMWRTDYHQNHGAKTTRSMMAQNLVES
jgi:hypothetical protein